MIYFAYGSNMDWSRISSRCPSARFLFTAKLEGFRLEFTRYSRNNRCGAADIVFDGPSTVWGVAYHIEDTDRPALERAEGVPVGAYEPFTVDVHPDGDRAQRIKAVTYVVVNKETPRPRPSAAYKDMLISGATHRALPADYVEKLKRIETA